MQKSNLDSGQGWNDSFLTMLFNFHYQMFVFSVKFKKKEQDRESSFQ